MRSIFGSCFSRSKRQFFGVYLHSENSASEMPTAFSAGGTDESPKALDHSTEALCGSEEAVYANVEHKTASVLESMPKHCDKFVRDGVALVLAVIGAESGSAVRSLAKALKHDEMGVRLSAVIALGALGQHSAEAVSELVSALKDGEWRVRHQCLRERS